jgi:hypothetical protein
LIRHRGTCRSGGVHASSTERYIDSFFFSFFLLKKIIKHGRKKEILIIPATEDRTVADLVGDAGGGNKNLDPVRTPGTGSNQLIARNRLLCITHDIFTGGSICSMDHYPDPGDETITRTPLVKQMNL